jgi:hypothetical protein
MHLVVTRQGHVCLGRILRFDSDKDGVEGSMCA